MRSTCGSRTCSIMSRMRLRRARASRSVWAHSTSSIWRPTGTTGLSAVIGSWKIIAIRVARNCRKRRSLAVNSSSPTSFMLPPVGISAFFCNRPITVSAVTDLPEPLSPTRHSVSRSWTSREIPSMMRRPLGIFAEADDEIVDGEDGHLPASRCFMRGSSASRAASPIKLTLRIVIDSNRPGQKISDGLIRK